MDFPYIKADVDKIKHEKEETLDDYEMNFIFEETPEKVGVIIFRILFQYR